RGRGRGASGRRFGEARGAHLPQPQGPEGAVHRGRRDDRAVRDPLRRPGARAYRGREPHRRARRAARAPLQRRGDRAQGPPRAAARVRHRGLVHRLFAAHPRQGPGRAGAAGAQAPSDVHGRPRGAARHRAGGGRARRRVPVHGGRPRADRLRQPRLAPFGGGAGRGDHRNPGRPVHALDAGAGERAAHSRAARARRAGAAPGARARAARAAARRRSGRGAGSPVAGAHRQAAARADAGAERGRRRRGPRPGRNALAALPHQVKPTLRSKLDSLVGRLNDLDGLLASENATRDMDQFRKLSRERAELSNLVALYENYRKAEGDAEAARELDLAEDLKDSRAAMERIEGELQKALLPKDPNDERNIFLEVRAGAGGDESALFAGEVFRMYARYAERQRWQVEIISESPSELGGYKEVIARVVGQGAYSRLKFESGGHRVQRVPETEAQGRIHTSACTVA